MMQLLFGPRGLEQVFVCAKSPLARILPMGSGEAPLFITVTFWGGLVVPTCCGSKTRFGGEIRTPVPVPVIIGTSGVAGSLLRMVTLPKRIPETVGENLTSMVQLCPTARVFLHVVVCVKSPRVETLQQFRERIPEFFTVRRLDGELVFSI